MEDVFAHIVISGVPVEGLVIALLQNCVALLKCKQQNLILRGKTEAIREYNVRSPLHKQIKNLKISQLCFKKTHIRGTPVLKHSKNMAELDLQSKASFPFWLHSNVLAKLSLHLLHTLV